MAATYHAASVIIRSAPLGAVVAEGTIVKLELVGVLPVPLPFVELLGAVPFSVNVLI